MRVTALAAALALLVSTPLLARQPTRIGDAAITQATQLRDAALTDKTAWQVTE